MDRKTAYDLPRLTPISRCGQVVLETIGVWKRDDQYENCITIEINSLNGYIESSNERALGEVHRENILREKDEGKDKEAIMEERKQTYLDKPSTVSSSIILKR